MATLILKPLEIMLQWLKNNKRLATELILGALLALSITCGTTIYKKNKSLTESLNKAQNNIEAYQEIVDDSQQASTVLKLTVDDLKNSNDKLIHQLDSVMKDNKINRSDFNTAATQTQTLDVSKSKGVGGQIIVVNDTVYTDSINYNDLTKVHYSIGNDSISIRLDVKNTQYLYTFKSRQYKNKKSFIKRLFTLDFKKVDRYKYKIINTNDLLKESDIRIIER